jgi:hypothetical protein
LDRVAPFLAAYIDLRDFYALARADRLEKLFEFAEGDIISCIRRTREALNLYAEHLRQLSARTA